MGRPVGRPYIGGTVVARVGHAARQELNVCAAELGVPTAELVRTAVGLLLDAIRTARTGPASETPD